MVDSRKIIFFILLNIVLAISAIQIGANYSLTNIDRQSIILVEEHHGQILGRDFATDVTLTARFRVEDIQAFESALISATRGTAEIEILELNSNTIMPLEDS